MTAGMMLAMEDGMSIYLEQAEKNAERRSRERALRRWNVYIDRVELERLDCSMCASDSRGLCASHQWLEHAKDCDCSVCKLEYSNAMAETRPILR